MAILQEDVERVRQSVDLVALASDHVALKRTGRNWVGICPFHAENSGSFNINPERGTFYCFGCQAKGDAITFIREIEHLDFTEAMEKLAGRAGIELRYDNSNAAAERKERKLLNDAMEQAVEWYHERLLKSPDAASARSYLRSRGFDGDLVREFRLGWAPEGWDELSRALRLSPNVLKDTGLGFVNRRGRPQDAFRNRVLFPIFDAGGKAVAFGGRILPGGEGPKYKNSSETPLYAKSRTLYALNWAKTDVVDKGEVIVCEGYTDVIGFFQAGVPRAVATCGTALTEEHVRHLKNFSSRIVLAYDADSAGQAAAARFYEWERKLGIDIAVAAFPPGTDPADAARRDPSILQTAVKDAQPFLKFRLDRALDAANLATPEGRARAAEMGLAMVAGHPNHLVREQYLMHVSDRVHVPIEQLRDALASGQIKVEALPGARNTTVRSRRPSDDPPRVELETLRIAVNQPEDVARVLDRIVPPSGAAGIEEVLFDDHRSRAAFVALTTAPTLLDAMDVAEPEAAELLARLAVEEGEGSASDAFGLLIDRAAKRFIRQLEVEVRVQPNGFRDIQPTLAWLILTSEQLRQTETATEAAAALLAWLLEQVEGE